MAAVIANLLSERCAYGPRAEHRSGDSPDHPGREVVNVPTARLAGLSVGGAWKPARMTYDLAVWEGDRPRDDAAAERLFTYLHCQYIDSDIDHPPTYRITEYVKVLLTRFPDMSEDDEEDPSPFSVCPLIDAAAGPLIYFAMRWSMAKEVSAYAAEVAASMGLVCYDPQMECLRP